MDEVAFSTIDNTDIGFAFLGAVNDFHSDLISFESKCFARQCLTVKGLTSTRIKQHRFISKCSVAKVVLRCATAALFM